MRSIELTRPNIEKTFRLTETRAIFDMSETHGSKYTVEYELPSDDEWTIGAIVGPSGTGKSTILQKEYANAIFSKKWPRDKSILDGFAGDVGLDTITHTLSSVGFSSPPSWTLPYGALSNGQQFRVDLAAAILSDKPLVAIDEYTSVVDRVVAKIGSHAVQKACRKANRKIVVAACHYDILEWLRPDWTMDLASGKLARGALPQRPKIKFEIRKCDRSLWQVFAKHHYLNNEISAGASCYAATVDGNLAGFCGVISSFGQKGNRRVSRVVVLPDYQGIGIAGRMIDFVGGRLWVAGLRLNITTSHPQMISGLDANRLWERSGSQPFGFAANRGKNGKASAGRSVSSFKYVGGGN